jgi:hypothetical protein
MADTFAKVTSNDPAIVTAAVYSVLTATGSATAHYTIEDGVISAEIAKTAQPVAQPAPVEPVQAEPAPQV